MGRGKRRGELLLRQPAGVVLSDGGRDRQPPEGLGAALVLEALESRPHQWPLGLAVRANGAEGGKMLGRAETVVGGIANVWDPARRVSYGRAYLEEANLVSVSDFKDDCVARVFPDPNYGGCYQVVTHDWRALGEIYLEDAKISAGVFSGDKLVGTISAKKGQRIDMMLAGVCAFFFLLDPLKIDPA